MWESKVAALSGVLFVVLLVASALVTGNFDFMPPEDEIAAFYEADSARIMAGAYAGLVAGFFLLWFSGSVKAALAREEGSSDRLSTIAFGGGLLASTGVSLSYLATMYGAERAGLHGAIDPGGAAVLFDIASGGVGTFASFGFAALIGAYAIVALRSGSQPGWLTWSSLVLAVGLLSPVNWVVIGLVVVWVPVVAIRLYREDGARVSVTAAAEAVR